MTVRVNIAKTTLSDVVDQVQAGEEVILTRDGEPVATLRAIKPALKTGERRKLGVWDHLNVKVPDEVFFDPDPEVEAAMDEPVWPKP